MMKRLIPSTVLFLTAILLHAQTPQSLLLEGPRGTSAESQRSLMCNDAGTITFGPNTHTGQSTDIGQDTVFLCFGDQILIDHDEGTEDLSGDPDPSTPAGVGYAFYECQPSIMGNDINAIKNDNCLYQNPFFTDENNVIIGTIGPDSIWFATGMPNPDGDILFENTGALQNGFNAGAPVLFWFAPITYDALSGTQPVYEGSPAGSCVNVNTDEAFAVVYLNEIRATEINTNAGVMGCRGSFRISGGLPEFDGGNYASIDIRLVDDPSIQGEIISGIATHFENVIFTIPRPGTYEIVVEDEKGCMLSFTMDMNACEGVGIQAGNSVGMPGTQVCIPVTVTDFDSIQTLQLSLNWDPEVLQFDSLSMIHPEITDGDLEIGDINVAINEGILPITWVSEEFDKGACIPLPGASSNENVIFSLCFTLIGEDDEGSTIAFTNNPAPAEVSNINNQVLGLIAENGLLFISENPVSADITQDSVSCNGESDGSFTVTVVGDNPPFTFNWDTIGGTAGIGPFPIDESGENFTIGGLSAGIYTVTVQDSGNPAFEDIDTIEILQPGILGANISFTQPLCFEDSTATVMVNITLDNITVNNPDPNEYSFNWDGPATGNGQSLNDVPSGLYSVTVTNSNSCTVQDNETVPEPAPLTTNIAITNATCSGAPDGVISVNPMGGTTADGTYTFDWGCGISLPQGQFGSQTVNGLEPDCYCFTITDDNNCQFMDTVCVSANKELVANAIITDASCNSGCDGSITITASTLGAPPAGNWTFSWTGPNNAPIPSNDTDNSSTISDLCAGTYRLIQTDSDPAGCELDTTFVILEPSQLSSIQLLPPLLLVLLMVWTVQQLSPLAAERAVLLIIGQTPF